MGRDAELFAACRSGDVAAAERLLTKPPTAGLLGGYVKRREGERERKKKKKTMCYINAVYVSRGKNAKVKVSDSQGEKQRLQRAR